MQLKERIATVGVERITGHNSCSVKSVVDNCLCRDALKEHHGLVKKIPKGTGGNDGIARLVRCVGRISRIGVYRHGWPSKRAKKQVVISERSGAKTHKRYYTQSGASNKLEVQVKLKEGNVEIPPCTH